MKHTPPTPTNYLNHIAFVIDESGSMACHRDTVVSVFDEQVKQLAERSKTLGQETRVSLYLFNGLFGTRCIVYDTDVLRLPSLAGKYRPTGGTPLVRATLSAIEDLQLTPQIHADHAFLVYVLTDGEETDDRHPHATIPSRLRDFLNAQKENWTVAALVPNERSALNCRDLGFHSGNILQWDTHSADGLNKASDTVSQSTHDYMTLRAKGIRSTKGLFVAQVAAKRPEVISKLKPVTNPYTVYSRPAFLPKLDIKSFVEQNTGQPYMVGSAYYALVKTEVIQSNKRICLRTVPDGRLFSGSLDEVRGILGLPAGGDIKVAPGTLKDFQVFVESTSVNRNIVPGQEVLVIKL